MSTIKKAFLPLHTALSALEGDTTIETILADKDIMKLMEASKGGFTGENSFVTINDQKVARICAMTGAVYAHDNTDKTASFFYKNGSYMIGAEIVKANSRKAWETARGVEEAELEDQMLEGDISPKEWKEQVTALKKNEFEFVMDDARKAELVEAFDGYPTKEAFTEAYNSGDVPLFTDYTEVVEALRAEGKEEPTEG